MLWNRLITLTLPTVTSALCYFPDGTRAYQDLPCALYGNSTCCSRGFACLSNNVCKRINQALDPAYMRASCTDKTWSDTRCPLFCINPSAGDLLSAGKGMDKCSNSNASTEIYYCENQQNENGRNSASVSLACSVSSVAFKGVATVITTIGYTSTSIASSSTTSKPFRAPRTASGGVVISGLSSETALALALGTSFGIIAIAGLFLCFLAHRYSKQQKRMAQRVQGSPATSHHTNVAAPGQPPRSSIGLTRSLPVELDTGPYASYVPELAAERMK